MSKKQEQQETGDDINTTQLYPDIALGRLISHRDITAHWIRFCHIAKQIKANNPKVILDVGCGNKTLAMTLYSNKHSKGVAAYHGVDLRDVRVKGLEGKEPFPIHFYQQSVCEELPKVDPDIVVNFEVIEHMSKEAGLVLLDQLKAAMVEKTELYLSTPVFDVDAGAADNHIYEWGYQELKDELEKRFTLVKHWGTFMNTGIGPNKKFLEETYGKEKLDQMREYFDNNMMSNILAPAHPERSRNCLWKLKLK